MLKRLKYSCSNYKFTKFITALPAALLSLPFPWLSIGPIQLSTATTFALPPRCRCLVAITLLPRLADGRLGDAVAVDGCVNSYENER